MASRHRSDRALLPALPVCYENENTAALAIETEWSKPGITGVAAVDGERLIGYLFGQKIDSPLRGRHVWVSLAGHALAPELSAEWYRDLYSFASQQWVDEGYFLHCSLLPASDPAILDAWFRLGFGHEQVHALLSLEHEFPTALPLDQRVEIRLATPDDRELLSNVSSLIRTYQANAPTLAVALPEDAQKVREGYGKLAVDPEADIWLALKDGEVISFQGYFPTSESKADMITPDRCVELGIAATRPEFGGRGINYALTVHGFTHARDKGYKYCMTDWRMTNLQSSRYWPRQGFRPAAYRVSRLIDQRIAWAKG